MSVTVERAAEISELMERLSEVPVELSPVASQWTIARWLESNSFSFEWEVRVPDRGDGRSGRVDLVARRPGLTLAIEIDKAAPKPKSIIKIRQIPDAVRVVALRGVDGGWMDEVVGRQNLTRAQISDADD